MKIKTVWKWQKSDQLPSENHDNTNGQEDHL